MSQTTIGEWIKTTRESTGVSQTQLSNYTKQRWGTNPENTISANFISEIESGKKGISLNKLNLITESLLNLGSK